MKKITLKNGIEVKLTKIEDIASFRGHYVKLKGQYYRSNFNCSQINGKYERGYEKGYKLTHGSNIVEHLFNKLKEGLKLTEYELVDFYNKVSIFNPVAQMAGIWYRFSEVMQKMDYVDIWTLTGIPNKTEKQYISERGL